MINKIEYQGFWWIQEKPENKIPGILNFSYQNGAELQLMGSFTKDIKSLLDYEIILGTTTNGKNITLNKCYQTNQTTNNPGITTSIFFIDKIFVGVHFTKDKDIIFKNLNIHFTNFDEWVNFKIGNKTKDEIIADIKKELKIKISLNESHSHQKMIKTTKYSTNLRIESKNKKNYDEWLKIIYFIRNFLTLGITKPIFPTYIQGETEINKTKINNKDYFPPVEILYKIPDYPEEIKNILKHQMLFSYEDISGDFTKVIKTWFETYESLSAVYNLYFANQYNPRQFAENQFLNYMMAIEAFHRITKDGTYLSTEEYEKIQKIIINSFPKDIDEDLKESLSNKIKFGNEFSLRKRIKELNIDYGENFSPFIEDIKAFSDKVVKTRNYLIHNSKDLEKQSAKGKDLISLNYKLKRLLEICILRKICFSTEEVNTLYKRNKFLKLDLN